MVWLKCEEVDPGRTRSLVKVPRKSPDSSTGALCKGLLFSHPHKSLGKLFVALCAGGSMRRSGPVTTGPFLGLRLKLAGSSQELGISIWGSLD